MPLALEMGWARHFVSISLLGLALPFITTAQVPSGPPRDITATATSSTTLRITWSDVPTDERHGTLLKYQVVLEGLQEYVQYTVQVRASNEDGYGPFSTPVSATTFQDECLYSSVPSSTPLNVDLSSNEPNQLHLTWDRPPEIETNGLLLFYSLRYHRANFDDYVFDTVNATSESVLLTGLVSHTVYEVFVAASTVNGTGPFARQTALTIETAPDSAPMNFTANSSTSYTIDMQWTPPHQSQWNGILRGYQLRYSQTDSTMNCSESYAWIEISISSADQTTYTLGDLCSSTVYCVQVAAVTVGPGPYTSPLYIETLPPTHGKPECANSTIGPNMNVTVNDTVSCCGGLVAVIAGSVVAGVVGVALVGVAFTLTVLVILRQRRAKKSMSLVQYFTSSSETTQHQEHHSHQSQGSQGDLTSLTLSNPTALSFTELQPNNPPLPTFPSASGDSGDGVREPPSSSVWIADNPQYNQFSSTTNATVGGARGLGGVVSFEASGIYDYPATFRAPMVTDSGEYAQVRNASGNSEELPYATVT